MIDGSTWDPCAQRLLFTTEGGASGGVVEATLDFPSVVDDMAGILDAAATRGSRTTRTGTSGSSRTWAARTEPSPLPMQSSRTALHRFIPKNKFDLDAGGKLQALPRQAWLTPGRSGVDDEPAAGTRKKMAFPFLGSTGRLPPISEASVE